MITVRDIFMRALPEHWVAPVVVVILSLALAWHARGYAESRVGESAAITRHDLTLLNHGQQLSTHEMRIDSLRAVLRYETQSLREDVGGLYDYLERILCLTEAASGQRSPMQCRGSPAPTPRRSP
jgi:hypothetical protein